MDAFFLMPDDLAVECAQLVQLPSKPHIGNTLADLTDALGKKRFALLLGFGTGVIVPPEILESGICALNIHGASPSYPGRDPHHWAAYDGVRQYGATLHYMAPKVDQGPIVDVELVDVEADCPPWRLLAQANDAGKRLYVRLMRRFLQEGAPPVTSMAWGPRVTKRSDFLDLCRVTPGIDRAEFARRLHATAWPGRSNLYTEIHGKRFRLEA